MGEEGGGTEWERQRSCIKDSKQEPHAEQRVYAGLLIKRMWL